MSFNQTIYGNLPQSGFTYTTNNISTDNVSTTNLSAVNASIVHLTTAVFEPHTLNVTELNCVSANISRLESNLILSQNLISTEGTINTFYSGFIQSVGALITDIRTDDLIANHIHVSNISLDGALGGHTINVVEINVQDLNAVNIETPNLIATDGIIDNLYIREQSSVITDKSIIKRDANEVTFIGKNTGDVNGVDFLFRTGIDTDVVKLKISRTSDEVEVLDLNVVGTITAETGLIANVNISDLVVSDTAQLRELEVLTSAEIANLTVYGAIGLYVTKGRIINLSSTNTSLNNVTAGTISAAILNGNISNNLIAGSGIALSTTSGITTITNIAGTSDPLNLNILNASIINSSNINNASIITTKDLNASNIGASLVAAANVITTDLTANTINSSTFNLNTLNASHVSSDDVLTLTVGANNAYITTGNISTIHSVNISNELHISSKYLHGDIFSNLASGTGISLSLHNGITTITNIAGTSDPLNLSVLNASTVNSNYINNINSVITAGLVSDTIHCSSLHSSQTIFANNLSFTNGIVGQAGTFIICPDIASVSIRADDINISSVANISNLNASTANISNLNSSSIISNSLTADISSNLASGPGISLSTIGGVTTIENTAQTSDPLNLSVLNVSNVNSNYINNINSVITTGLVSDTIHCSSLHSSQTIFANNISFTNGIVGQAGTFIICPDIASVSIRADDINISSVANISNLNVSIANISNLNSSSIISNSLTADLSSNLSAGFGIALSTTSGITTIDATGGLATSTQYGFQVYGTQGDIAVTAGQLVPNNAIEYCYPSSAAYNTGNYTYYVQSPGYYQCGFKIFQQNNAGAGPCRFAIFKNGSHALQGGKDVGTTETLSGLIYCNQGDYLDLRITTGVVVIYQGINHTWFYGYKLQPTNNTVGITTDLSVSTLIASLVGATEVVSTIATAPFMNTSVLNASTVNGNIANNLDAGNNINLITVAGVTSINAQIPSSYTNLTITNLSSTSITSQYINTSNLSTPLLGVGSFFTRRQNGVYSPGLTSQQYFSNFDTAVVSNPHVSWLAPNIGTGGAGTGFIINTSGTYKIDWTFTGHSVAYNNRIGWFSRLYKNNVTFDGDRYSGFIYTRGDQTSFAQWGTCSSHCIVSLVAGDYIHLVTNVAKNSPLHNNLWDQIEAGWGSVCSFQILAFA